MNTIYKITNNVNKKVYIGQTNNYEKRIKSHINQLKRNKHNNILLQRSFNIYGIENFYFEKIDEADLDNIDHLETFWIKKLSSDNSKFGYNIESGGNKNKTLSESTKEKLRKCKRNKSTKETISKKMYGNGKGYHFCKRQMKYIVKTSINKKQIFVCESNDEKDAKKKSELARKLKFLLNDNLEIYKAFIKKGFFR